LTVHGRFFTAGVPLIVEKDIGVDIKDFSFMVSWNAKYLDVSDFFSGNQ